MDMKIKQAYQEKAKAKLAEIKAQMSLLQARIGESQADAQIELNQKLGELNQQYEEAQSQLAALMDATEDAWQDLQEGMSKAIDELHQSLISVKDRIKA